MKDAVTFWYQWAPKGETKVLLYNHIENGWCEGCHPIPVSQQQLWWNSRDWCKKFGYLENGKAEELKQIAITGTHATGKHVYYDTNYGTLCISGEVEYEKED